MPAWDNVNLSAVQDEDYRLIDEFTRVLMKGPEGTFDLWLRWPKERKLKYIEHMKRCAARNPEKHDLFVDVVAQVIANSFKE